MSPPSRVLFGRNVNRLRLQRGWIQDELAERAAIDRRYVQRIEAGTANPGLTVIARLCAALRAQWDDLMHGLGCPDDE